MVIVGRWDERPITLNLTANCLTISTNDPAEADVFSYDHAGRLWTAYLDGVSYRRGLDGKLLSRWRPPGEARRRRWLPPAEAQQIEARAWRSVNALHKAITSGAAQLKTPLPQEGYTVLARAAAFDAHRSRADAARYHAIYKPVGILPPDRYMAIVLQATEGCSFNTCTFCSFYKDRPFRIKHPDEFRTHAEAVRDFLGAGLSLRQTIFLADANALVVPMPKLLPLLDAVHRVYDVEALGGIYAFLDGFSGEKKSGADYAQLAERGLRRVYVGLESGNEALLKFLKKPGTPTDAVKAVKAMKAAGVAVGVIVLLGAGGHRYAGGHVADTINAINAMRLGQDDIIYFSELIESEGLAYARDAHRAGLKPLTHDEHLAQGEAIRRGLTFSAQGGTPRISRYDIREFVY